MKKETKIFYFRLSAGRVYGVHASSYQEAEQLAKKKNKNALYMGSPELKQ